MLKKFLEDRFRLGHSHLMELGCSITTGMAFDQNFLYFHDAFLATTIVWPCFEAVSYEVLRHNIGYSRNQTNGLRAACARRASKMICDYSR